MNTNILKGKPSSLNNDSPIYIASHTKSFTGTLLKILEEQKKVDLQKSLADYLPELHYRDSIDTKGISVKSLLNHTHGTNSMQLTFKTAFLGYSGENSELIDGLNNEFINGMNENLFRYDPSHKFRYSNMGPVIAAMVVEKVTGNNWKDEMKRQIFDPLGMNNTSSNVSDFDFKTIRPSITVSKEQGVIEKDFYKKNITMHASGGILSTINDLSKWLIANIRQDEKLLNKASWTEMHTSTTKQDRKFFTYKRSGYSLGWDIAEYQGNTILTRFGGLAGIAFHASFMPEKNIGIIAFSNDNRASGLPHLMANYAYNEINALSATDSIYTIEKKSFDKRFDKRNKIEYPKETDLLADSPTNDDIVGVYKNVLDWPAISINKKDDHYIFNWGILDGKIYKKETGGFQSNLGVLKRSFEIKNDSLKTGSLMHVKAKE